MSYLQYLPFDEDPYDDMDWFAENPEFPVNQCYDPRTMCNTINCCPTTDLCEEIGIDQEPKIGNDGFTVSLDVSQFKPDEITVDTENNLIVVHARQEEKTNGKGYMSREFVRTYELPPQFKPEDVIAILSCDGILQIKVNKTTLFQLQKFPIFFISQSRRRISNIVPFVFNKLDHCECV